MHKIKVMTIFGTRPEAIKMAPIILELENQKEVFESIVVATAQHRQMMDQVLKAFDVKVDYDLNVMKSNQSLAEITSNVLMQLDKVMKEVKPDIVLVHGDTTTTLAASLAAFYNQIKIGHVEAGLRTWNKYSPFPEEMNRQLTDVMTDFYFAPTVNSEENLRKEQRDTKNIYVTGNTAIDALKRTISLENKSEIFVPYNSHNRIILLTMHRRENQGEPMEHVFTAIREVIEMYPDVEIVYPVHLNPVIQKLAIKFLENHPRIHLIEPLDVIDFHHLIAMSYMVMTDSGGIQEEAPSLGIPVLVLRDTTERPEGVAVGTLKLIGTEKETVKEVMVELLENQEMYTKMSIAQNPYGDGEAAKKILNIIKKFKKN
ncbi:non-hydrolyzing UDP-N-acetylglucosamine 2-epimerase [Carnobacterium divergens]|uniref:UDP-N-acetylglucosamine 2-epimerase (non-hydrolyzing) n=1 Tax=Carnobacterium divergens DSM 20623 TaxID=1449336 RepID=A0A0R2HX70_CARDV|nr:UDP-N-acetylglucosamine 2-epimerase (non-hydrolyzing) [Carnobacterium divergens]KRN57281.1 mnaA protein [Carnobacterium divergens DSM 20623]MDO0875397.1 UDP-N-acetylglucosamine 2-epimerase (non-hydrolyzing) [Carnobacterium divergens]SUX16977.1 UDP-N-acetylglucosamine 2-epimerase [Carnobacterium divergens]